jgi:protein-S-isoprenylcysteine O-methyltransferase Ste14
MAKTLAALRGRRAPVCDRLYAVASATDRAPNRFDTSAMRASRRSSAMRCARLFGPFSTAGASGFRGLTKIVPRSVERTTYAITSLLLLLIFWQWRAVPQVVWHASGDAARMAPWGAFWLGWLIVLLSTFMISHFDLFGLRQVMLNFQGQPYSHPPFMTRGFYRLVRHPIMLGFVIAFWAAPTMTLGHFFFAVATTTYIVIALQFEEKDLLDALGEAYHDYRRRVPMLIPWTKP